jgi:V/A-type H+-transporting ATPase subunit D
MSAATPSRGAVIEAREELRAMREGHALLDEKCMLLAGEILRELARYEALSRELDALDRAARQALAAAAARHGLQGLQTYPAADAGAARLERRRRSLMRVPLVQAELAALPGAALDPVQPSPEAEQCRARYAALIRTCARLAALRANLERLYHEYRRSVRRTRALQEVLIPELGSTLHEMEARLEELDQEEALRSRGRR